MIKSSCDFPGAIEDYKIEIKTVGQQSSNKNCTVKPI